MAVLIIGGGSVGRRHARLAAKLGLGQVTLVSKSAPDGLADTIVRSLEAVDLSDGFNFAVVASPATEHVHHIKALASYGVPALVEKPLSANSDSARDLVLDSELVRNIRVAYNFRFDSAFQALCDLLTNEDLGRPLRIVAHAGQDLRRWRPGRDYRDTVSARSALGGGVLLELSHEIDFLIQLAGSPISVSGRTEKISDLEIDVEDTADLDLLFESGIRASLHLNMVQSPFRRACEVIFTEGTAVWDLLTRRVRYRKADQDAWNVAWDGSKDSPDANYESQLREFARLVETKMGGGADHAPSPLATLPEAFEVLRVIDACRRSGDEGRREIFISA